MTSLRDRSNVKPFHGSRIGSHHGGHHYVDVGMPDCGLEHEHDSQCFARLRAGQVNGVDVWLNEDTWARVLKLSWGLGEVPDNPAGRGARVVYALAYLAVGSGGT
jgi:hypothetical protein